MTKFEFLITFLSIIIGISISKLIEDIDRSFRKRKQFYFLHTISWILLFLLLIQHWWATFVDSETLGNVSFVGFLIYLLPSIVLVVAADLFISDNKGDEFYDVKKHYWEISGAFFGSIAIYLITVFLAEAILFNRHPFLVWQATSIRVVGIMIMSVLAYHNKEKYERTHITLLIIGGVLLFTFIIWFTPVL